jgi:hypothetical protein
MSNKCIVFSWARTQQTVALSSAESEYYAIVSGIFEGLLAQSIVEDLASKHLEFKVYTDSTAARASMEKLGVQKMKHMALRHLFVKQLVDRKLVSLHRVAGAQNGADMLTKELDGTKLLHCMNLIGLCSGESFEQEEHDTEVNIMEAEFEPDHSNLSDHGDAGLRSWHFLTG